MVSAPPVSGFRLTPSLCNQQYGNSTHNPKQSTFASLRSLIFAFLLLRMCLINQLGGFDLLIFNNDRIVILGQGQRVNSSGMLCASGEFGSDKATAKYGLKILLNQILQRLLKLEVGLLDVGEFVVGD